MMENRCCKNCEAKILLTTYKKTGGYCVPCSQFIEYEKKIKDKHKKSDAKSQYTDQNTIICPHCGHKQKLDYWYAIRCTACGNTIEDGKVEECQPLKINGSIARPSVRKMVLLLCGVSLVLLFLYNICLTGFGIPRIVPGELIWIIISPAFISAAYRRIYKQTVPFAEAKKIGLYYVPIMLSIGLIAIFSANYQILQINVENNIVFLSMIGIAVLLFLAAILFFGPLIIAKTLNYKPVKKGNRKRSP